MYNYEKKIISDLIFNIKYKIFNTEIGFKIDFPYQFQKLEIIT